MLISPDHRLTDICHPFDFPTHRAQDSLSTIKRLHPPHPHPQQHTDTKKEKQETGITLYLPVVSIAFKIMLL